jgi:hypothetical protein
LKQNRGRAPRNRSAVSRAPGAGPRPSAPPADRRIARRPQGCPPWRSGAKKRSEVPRCGVSAPPNGIGARAIRLARAKSWHSIRRMETIPRAKKTAPARGKPKAGTAEVDNARTQLDTNDTQSLTRRVRQHAGVSGNAPLSGQCYTVVTPPPFRRSKCDAHHTALLRCNAVPRLILRVVVTNGAPGSKPEAVDDVGVSGVLLKVSHEFCLVSRCEK